MAGANNAQMKARGWKAADITRYRASHSGPMSDAALRRAGALPKKNSHAHKALAETIRNNRPATPAVRPEVARMRQAKANVDALRTARDERRASMAARRHRADEYRNAKAAQSKETPTREKLWRQDRNGQWVAARDVTSHSAAEWLRVYQKHHPGETFVVGSKRPPSVADLARRAEKAFQKKERDYRNKVERIKKELNNQK